MLPIPVKLGARSYDIHTLQQEAALSRTLKKILVGKKAIVLTSPRVHKFCFPVVDRALHQAKIPFQTIQVPDGEEQKNNRTLLKIYEAFLKAKADRSTWVVLLGGGVIGDMGGFAAATYLRGMPFIQIPTTLLAQVDSSIGGKLGLDLEQGKNLVGVIEQPKAVLAYTPFLQTLPKREIVGGLGEVIKYGIIKDPSIFKILMEKKDVLFDIHSAKGVSLMTQLIQASARIKAEVVSKDEMETKGLRHILNFGHTFGHAIEKLTHYSTYLHGEAIGIGMRMAADISVRKGHCSTSIAQTVKDGLKHIGLPTEIPNYPKKDWIQALTVDKKSRDGLIHYVFLQKIGKVVVAPITPEELVNHL